MFAQSQILEPDTCRFETNPASLRGRAVERFLSTGARIALLTIQDSRADFQILARAVAGIRETALFQIAQSLGVERFPLTLTDDRAIRFQPEPREIFENRFLGFIARPCLVVILDAKENLPPEGPRDTPDGEGARDVAEVKEARRRGRESREKARGGRVADKSQGQRFTATPMTSKRAPKRRAPEPRKARAGNSFLKYVR